MATTYYIKAYYTKEGQQQPEIRRFAIDISSQNDVYEELRTKIASFGSEQQSSEFTLQYVDEENERITFSSNDELRAAISLNKDSNTLKVFVTFVQPAPQQKAQPQPQQDTANKECHVGVECDGCHGPVIGFRYKCFVCPNYDLCEKCSAAGVHSEHNMIKITKPGNFHHPNGPHFNPHGHRHAHPHSHARHPGRHWRHSSPLPPFVPGREFIENVQAQIPQWLPNPANTAHFRAHVQQHLDSLKANTQTHMQNSKQYLETVGQYLQQALSPFGIDCDYRVDENTPTTNQQPEQEQAPAAQQEEQSATADAAPTREPDTVPKYPDLTSTVEDNEQEQTASVTASAAQESTPISDPIEKLVDECMEKMAAMGFTDVNGGLRELVRSKQGEINAVLDAINPRHYQA